MACAVLVLGCLTFTFVAQPVVGDYPTYVKFGHHAKQMQKWKTDMFGYFNQLTSMVNSMRTATEGLNATLQNAYSMADQQIINYEHVADHVINRLTDAMNNATSLPEYESPPAFQVTVNTQLNVPGFNYLPVKYANVLLNDGNHYSTTTGLFTAPEPGLYWFHATFTCTSGTHFTVLKRMRSGATAKVLAHMKYHISQETACTTLAVLQESDTVGVYPTTTAFNATAGYGNNFAGYLVARYDAP